MLEDNKDSKDVTSHSHSGPATVEGNAKTDFQVKPKKKQGPKVVNFFGWSHHFCMQCLSIRKILDNSQFTPGPNQLTLPNWFQSDHRSCQDWIYCRRSIKSIYLSILLVVRCHCIVLLSNIYLRIMCFVSYMHPEWVQSMHMWTTAWIISEMVISLCFIVAWRFWA